MCDLPKQKLRYAPVIAVAAALLCAILAASHVLLRCLPPQANSFFIFNANEDNRLCIDPVLKPRDSISPQPEKPRASSLVPVYLSSSSDSEIGGNDNIDIFSRSSKTVKSVEESLSKSCESPSPRRKITMKSMTAKIQEKLRVVTASRTFSTAVPLDTSEMNTMEI